MPVREQLIAQITLGIAAGDLKIGEKLPSTREVARRCDLHSNTVGSAYQKLVGENLLEFKKGSGFYVATSADERIQVSRQLERLIENFLESANALGFVERDIIALLKKPRKLRSTGPFVVVESDSELRQILIYELSKSFPAISGISLEEFTTTGVPRGSNLVAMLDEKAKMDPYLGGGETCIYLKGRSVSGAMSGQARPGVDDIVAVVSGWAGFLSFGRIMLLAANVDPGNLIIRSTGEDGWKEAISRASMIICDTMTAAALGKVAHVREFQIISDESFDEIAMVSGMAG
ncbi:MAG: GntR family transcriptional regulator [Pyrinomonadaceae bacterium]